MFFFGFEILIFSRVVKLLEKVLALSLKLDLVFPHQVLAEKWLLFVFLIIKRKFCVEVVIFS